MFYRRRFESSSPFYAKLCGLKVDFFGPLMNDKQIFSTYFFLAKKTFPNAPRLIGFRISKSSIVGAKFDDDDGFLMKESDDPFGSMRRS